MPIKDRFQDAFAALWRGDAEGDGFNALVLQAGLTWRQASILRAYAKYLRQGGSTFSQDYIEECLLAHVDIARLLVQLFEARFDPARACGVPRRADELVRGDHRGARRGGEPRPGPHPAHVPGDDPGDAAHELLPDRRRRQPEVVAVRSSSTPPASPTCPMPRPRFEIWVYSPRVEGVHLRFGPVARGGLRWSDRREDFRTEVLGLVKAQTVKNAVIVPVGAKGGFVVKQPVDDPSDREAVMAEGVACYTTFIRGLLDVTDNRVDGEICPAARRRSPRRRRPVPRRRRRQGHGDVLRHRQRRRRRLRLLAGRRVRVRRLESATTTRRWASPRAVHGSR